jgi:hypothetical protein
VPISSHLTPITVAAGGGRADWSDSIAARSTTAASRTVEDLGARFASQFAYLAELHNQIKRAEAHAAEAILRGPLPTLTEVTLAVRLPWDVLAEWKAGFLEDAEALHLATKSLFASDIKDWGIDPQVRQAIARTPPGGQASLDRLLVNITAVVQREDAKVKAELTK